MNKIPPVFTLSQNDKVDLCIIGLNETAERITQFVERYDLFNIVGYAVDRSYLTQNQFHGKPVWAIEELVDMIDKNHCLLFVALFWNHLNGDRRRLYERLKHDGWKFANVISPLAAVRGSVGDNCWIMDYAVTQENSIIGDNVIVADYAFVGNTAQIGNHCFLGPRCTVMGSARIGEQSFIGICATIFDVVKVGKKCLIGACSIQKYDIPDFTVCKMALLKSEMKHYTEDEIENKWIAKHPNRINKNRNK